MYSNQMGCQNMSNQYMPNPPMANSSMGNKCMLNQPHRMHDAQKARSMNPEHQTMYKCDCTLAMASVPMQKFENLYDAETGYHKGSIFKGLDKPFKGGNRGCR